MSEQRSLKIDLAALFCLALALFLALALLTYDPADPPAPWVYPPRAEVANVCGHAGAWAAHLLLSGLGVGAYYLVVSLIGLNAALLTRKQLTEPAMRAVGWTLSLVAVTTLASLALDGFSPGPLIGPGGYLGAMGRTLLETHFRECRRLHPGPERVRGRAVAVHRLCVGAAERLAVTQAGCCRGQQHTASRQGVSSRPGGGQRRKVRPFRRVARRTNHGRRR